MNTSKLLFRQLTEGDVQEVAALEAKAFPTPWSGDQYRIIMQQGRCTLFGAWAGDILAGYIAVAMHSAVQEMEVYNIAVDERCRQRGIGKKLLCFAIEAAAKNGVKQIILEVRTSNAPALALYRSLQFIQVGIRAGYYPDTGEHALVLARSLK